MIREAAGNLIANFKVAGPTGEWFPELDDDRSMFPQDMTSGIAVLSTASVYQLLSAYGGVGSMFGHWFKPEAIIIDNDAGQTNKVVFYNGPSASATAFAVKIKASDTLFIDRDNLKGLIFTSGVFVSNLVASLTIRVGGKLFQSLPTGQI